MLDTGRYYIRALAGDKPYIGRYYHEDKSLMPKRVVELHDGPRPQPASDGKQHPIPLFSFCLTRTI
jgi:hypothetical protein